MRYLYNGHEVDVYLSVGGGYVAYLDNDLEPQTISEEEFMEYTTNGEFISFFRK